MFMAVDPVYWSQQALLYEWHKMLILWQRPLLVSDAEVQIPVNP